MKITLQDVQRGYDDWAAQPHNKKWVRKIDGTPIANDIVVRIFDALSQAEPTPHPSDAERHERAVPVAWQYFCDDEWRHSTAPERHREIGYPMRPLYVSPPAAVQEPVAVKALVESLASYLCDEWDFELDPCVGYSWPEHPNDDGYRGDGQYVKLQPSDVQARARENASRILAFLSRSALSTSQSDPAPEIAALPQDVINLVIAAREAFDTGWLEDPESNALDKALEAFSSRVPYENEPADLTPEQGEAKL